MALDTKDFGPDRDGDRVLRAAAHVEAGASTGRDRACAGHPAPVPAPVPARGHAVAQLAGDIERFDAAPYI
jgi:hypothetical protein